MKARLYIIIIIIIYYIYR